MSKVIREERYRVKRFLYRELAEYYKVGERRLSRELSGYDLRTVSGCIGAIRKLERRGVGDGV